jgi:hypothetical protein
LAATASAQTYNLSRTYKSGDHAQATWELAYNIKSTRIPQTGGSMPTPGVMSEKGKVDITVPDAIEGKFQSLDLAFGACEGAYMAAGARRPAHLDHPLNNRKVHIDRREDADTHEVNFDINMANGTLTPDMESALRCAFCASCMPAKPVAVGDHWQSERTDVFFGTGTKGSMEMTFASIEQPSAGIRLGVVRFKGTAQLEKAVGLETGGADVVIDMTFTGVMKVDLDGGLVRSVTIDGPAVVTTGAAINAIPMVQDGTVTYHMDVQKLKSTTAAHAVDISALGQNVNLRPVEAQDTNPLGMGTGNAPRPPLADAAFAGVFKNDQLSIEIVPAASGYSGTIHFGDKAFPFTASKQGDALDGQFKSGDDAYHFTASLAAEDLTFVTGGKTYTLKKNAQSLPQTRPSAGG